MKPILLMLDEMTLSAKEMLKEYVEFKYADNSDYSSNFSMVYTGLTPIVTNATVFCPCTGIDHIQAPKVIYLDDEFKQGIGQSVTSTAEHTWSLILQLAKINRMQLRGKTLGVIGCGRIGTKVAETAWNGFHMNIFTNDIKDMVILDLQEVEAFKTHSLDLTLHKSDIITLHVPLNEQTKGMIGEKEISQMKDGALLVNTARSQIVDEKSVIEALKSGKLAGYAHDFKPQTHTDTDKRQKLWHESGVLDKVIATPHIGGNTIESREITDKYIANKIIEFIKN